MALTRPKASQINFDVTNITDPLIRLNSGETGSADKDSGVVIERGDDQNRAIIWDESADQWAFVNTTEDGTTSGNVTIASYAGLKAGELTITKSAIAEITALSDGSTITPDFDAGQNFSVTLAGNRTLANPSNITAGQTGSIFVTQDGTGSRTLAYGSYWDFAAGTAPTMTTTAAAVDRIDYVVRTSTSIHAVATLAYS